MQTGQDAATTDNSDTGTEPKNGAVYTQAELDQRVSQAIKKREEKAQTELAQKTKEAERIALLQAGEHEKLYRETQAELDEVKNSLADTQYQNEANGVLVKLGLSHFSDVLIPGTKEISELLQRAEAFKAGVEAQAEQIAQQRLETGKAPVPTNTQTQRPKTIEEISKDPELWKQYKKDNNLV
ncbi:MAG: capsid assembly scaffolding protein Gp46 family protein [Planctomycetota bacterium]|jgi:hypothetical protein